jgi:hypothetical protein
VEWKRGIDSTLEELTVAKGLHVTQIGAARQREAVLTAAYDALREEQLETRERLQGTIAVLEAELAAAAMTAASETAKSGSLTEELRSVLTAREKMLLDFGAEIDILQSTIAELRVAHAREAAAAGEREGLLKQRDERSVDERTAMQNAHTRALEAAAFKLTKVRTSAEEERKKLETQLLDLANETSAAHATALGEAASELSKYRSEHAAELGGCQEKAEETRARLEGKIASMVKKCASLTDDLRSALHAREELVLAFGVEVDALQSSSVELQLTNAAFAETTLSLERANSRLDAIKKVRPFPIVHA